MNSIFKRLFNIKGMVVENVRIVDEPVCLNPYSRCGTPARGPAPMLPLRQTSVQLRPRRWERRWRHQDFGCWRVEPGSRFTRDFEAECAWVMTVASQRTVSGFLHVAWRTAGQIARRVAGRLKAAVPSLFDGLHAIGVDATSYRKGHTYITVVLDHERRRVIWAHDGYGRDVFDLFFKQLTDEQRASIRVVTGDGAKWIDSCVGEWCPAAQRVLDGFHIVSWMTGALDRVRKRLWNDARHYGDREGVKRMRVTVCSPKALNMSSMMRPARSPSSLAHCLTCSMQAPRMPAGPP
ncbi:hypothetical protein EMO90_06080 [Bifidobacterium vespertilionis]|uniref:ISL3 family transposase n=2 Tax=Bifidobacterium vespertilionis TaxID=2562524 RepID=A0A5J5DY78_9BIFI|nr:hypothetical protein EMO90_06080 [Bifidobacterium vespertilionis]KAA8821806.1 hypothetical protein EM848_10100 [Bifidobacterium vespertilionis]